MSEAPRFFDLERDPSKIEIYRPVSLLRTTEWGLLTAASLLAAFAFPPYFVQVLWIAFWGAGGLLWVTHLSEKGRQRLRDFERQFAQGHALEQQGRLREAAAFYETLIPRFQDVPKIAEIASRRIAWLKQTHPQAFRRPARRRRRA